MSAPTERQWAVTWTTATGPPEIELCIDEAHARKVHRQYGPSQNRVMSRSVTYGPWIVEPGDQS